MISVLGNVVGMERGRDGNGNVNFERQDIKKEELLECLPLRAHLKE